MAIPFREVLRQAIGPVLAVDDQAKVLLLTCIDLRYPHRIVETMDSMDYRGRYYHMALAGASHAANHDETWSRTFREHISFAIDHGQVRGILILDHLSCKAYELYEGVPAGDLNAERMKHFEVATRVVAQIVAEFPKLAGNVKALLLPVEPPQFSPEELACG